MDDRNKKLTFIEQLNLALGKVTRSLSDSAMEQTVREMSKIEIGLLMLIAGYLGDPSLKDKSTSEVISAMMDSPQGLEILTKNLRGNGVETTDLEVLAELDKLISRILDTGINYILLAFTDYGIDVSPPCASKTKFGDIGIEDPFKDSPEA